MTKKTHQYELCLRWTGNLGTGTSKYDQYQRDHEISRDGKPNILASSDPAFRGDTSRWNPEELLLASLASCHQLWYLHLCSVNGIVVEEYQDNPTGQMTENEDGSGEFSVVVLKPNVVVAPGADLELGQRLHSDAAKLCFIARSMNFPVKHEPMVKTS